MLDILMEEKIPDNLGLAWIGKNKKFKAASARGKNIEPNKMFENIKMGMVSISDIRTM